MWKESVRAKGQSQSTTEHPRIKIESPKKDNDDSVTVFDPKYIQSETRTKPFL